MLTRQTLAAEEAAIRQLIDETQKDICARNIPAIMARYAADAVSFDAIPPLVHDLETLRKNWEMCFSCTEGGLESSIRDLHVTVSDEVAFSHGLLDFTHSVGTPNQLKCCMRMTTCYRKIEGQWKIVRDHCSAPFDPQTNKACLDLNA